jgi:hypothetical protein
VARSELIAQIHEAKYELQIASLHEKANRLRTYETLLAEAAKLYRCSPYELEQVLREDYRLWRKQLNLPPPPPRLGL